jgi:hypothetical protein
MHALWNRLDAVVAPGDRPAALLAPAYLQIERHTRLAGLHDRLMNGGKITPAEIDQAVRRHSLGTTASIAIKNTLTRLGLMHDGGLQIATSAAGAVESKEYGAIAHLMHSTGLHEKLLTKGRVTAAELDAASQKSDISPRDKIALRSVLHRYGLISD